MATVTLMAKLKQMGWQTWTPKLNHWPILKLKLMQMEITTPNLKPNQKQTPKLMD